MKCCLWRCVNAHIPLCLLLTSDSQRRDFANVQFGHSRSGGDLISKRLVGDKVSEKKICLNYFANLNMSPLCSVLAHMHVSYKKHVITVSSVTSPESCTLPGRSGVHKKTTLSICFQHLNPERYICFPRNCVFGESRLGFHFQKGSCN